MPAGKGVSRPPEPRLAKLDSCRLSFVGSQDRLWVDAVRP